MSYRKKVDDKVKEFVRKSLGVKGNNPSKTYSAGRVEVVKPKNKTYAVNRYFYPVDLSTREDIPIFAFKKGGSYIGPGVVDARRFSNKFAAAAKLLIPSSRLKISAAKIGIKKLYNQKSAWNKKLLSPKMHKGRGWKVRER